MRTRQFLPCGVLTALLMLSVPMAHATDGGQRVHRCLGQHGEVVFTGLPCAADAATAGAAAEDTPSAVPVDRCAASREELRARIAAAIAQRHPNALAGLLRWRGIGASAATAHLRTLRELAQRPLLGIDDSADAAQGEAGIRSASDGLRVRTGSGDAGGVREQVFGVSVEGGCYWLAW